MLIGLDVLIPDIRPQVTVFILVIIWCHGHPNPRLQILVPVLRLNTGQLHMWSLSVVVSVTSRDSPYPRQGYRCLLCQR